MSNWLYALGRPNNCLASNIGDHEVSIISNKDIIGLILFLDMNIWASHDIDSFEEQEGFPE